MAEKVSWYEMLYVASIVVTAVVPLMLSTCRRFDDYIGGRLAFALVSFVSWIILLDMIRGTIYEVLPTTLLYSGGIALFFLWYLGRFYRKQYLIWKASGEDFLTFTRGRGGREKAPPKNGDPA